MKLLYRIPEACEALGVGRTRLYGAMRTGELHSVKDGASRLIPADALEAFADKLAGREPEADTSTATVPARHLANLVQALAGLDDLTDDEREAVRIIAAAITGPTS